MPRCVHAQARYTVVCSVLQLLNDKSIANKTFYEAWASSHVFLDLLVAARVRKKMQGHTVHCSHQVSTSFLATIIVNHFPLFFTILCSLCMSFVYKCRGINVNCNCTCVYFTSTVSIKLWLLHQGIRNASIQGQNTCS